MARKDLAVELIKTMQLVQRHVRQQIKKDDRLEFSMSQIRILSVLEDRSYSLSDIADFVGVDITSMSRMIKTLERRGLVSRRTATEDRRRVDFELTGKGRRAHQLASGRVRDELRHQLRGLSSSEAENVEAALSSLRKMFDVGVK
jgi:MarR family transcriptional regulator for hemolysin